MAARLLHNPAQIGKALKVINEHQDGKCLQCKKPITETDKIVSRVGWNAKYYHKTCAKFLKII